MDVNRWEWGLWQADWDYDDGGSIPVQVLKVSRYRVTVCQWDLVCIRWRCRFPRPEEMIDSLGRGVPRGRGRWPWGCRCR